MRALTEWGGAAPGADPEDTSTHTWELTPDEQAMAMGSWHTGSPDQNGRAVFEGLYVPPGRYLVRRPVLFGARRIVGPHGAGSHRHRAAFWADPDAEYGWPYLAMGWPGGGHLSHVGLAGRGVVQIGVLANRINGSELTHLAVSGCTQVGLRADRCQISRLESITVSGCPTGVELVECNGSVARNLHVAGCSGDGVVIQGGLITGGPFANSVALDSVTVERCGGHGLVIRNSLAPVHVSGAVHLEANGGAGLLVDNATAVIDAAYITGPTGHLAVQVRNEGRLLIRQLTLGGTYATVDVDSGSQLRGRVSTYKGNRIRLPNWPRWRRSR